jgi:hypothetical protein
MRATAGLSLTGEWPMSATSFFFFLAHWHMRSHVRDNNLVQGNIILGCTDYSITVDGNNAVVSDNIISGRQYGIEIGNKFQKCDATGSLTRLFSDGYNPTVSGNRVEGCPNEPINVDCEDTDSCTGGSVSHNYMYGGVHDDYVRPGIVCNHGNGNN